MADATGFKVLPRPQDDKVDLLLIESINHVSRLSLEPRNTSVLAGELLGAAAEVFRQSGKPPPYMTKEEAVSSTGVRCSGLNIGPANQPGMLALMFHFGETTLSILVPQKEARTFAERLMTAAAPTDAAPHPH